MMFGIFPGGKREKVLSLWFPYQPISGHRPSFGMGATLGGQFFSAQSSSQGGSCELLAARDGMGQEESAV